MWQAYSPVLAPVVAFSGEPYVDTDSGSSLSESGRMYYDNVRQAQLLAKQNVGRLHRAAHRGERHAREADLGRRRAAAVVALGRRARGAGARRRRRYLQLTRAKHERAAREAQEQTRDILKTVREGFFLLDADYRIGSVWSEALTHIFGRGRCPC